MNELIAPDTWLVRRHSLVVTGPEPVVVDGGAGDAVFSVVDRADVRWIFLPHGGAGSSSVVARCPEATVVTAGVIRDGGWFTAGERDLIALAPPLPVAPDALDLFDASTGVYWSSGWSKAAAVEAEQLGTRLQRIRSLAPTVVVGPHGVLRAREIAVTLVRLGELPYLPTNEAGAADAGGAPAIAA